MAEPAHAEGADERHEVAIAVRAGRDSGTVRRGDARDGVAMRAARIATLLVALLVVLVAVAGHVAADARWCSSGNAAGEVPTPSSDRPCRAPPHATDAHPASDAGTDRNSAGAGRRGAPAGKHRSNAGSADVRGQLGDQGPSTAADRGRDPPGEPPSSWAAHPGQGSPAAVEQNAAGGSDEGADRRRDVDEPAELDGAGAAADSSRANAEARQPERDSSPDVGDVRERLPADGTPLGFGGVAVFGGIVVARRAGTTAGIAPDVVTTTARTSSDVVPPVARTAAEFVRRRVPDGGWLLGGGLYSRHDDSDPLAHDKRSAAFELIQQSPGVNLSSLAERLDIPLSTARHHLRVLEREGLVKDRKISGKRRFVALGTEASETIAAAHDTATARVLRVLARRGPSSVSALAEYLDRDPSTVTYHLKRLESASLVDRHRDGRSVTNELTRSARSLIRTGRAGDGLADRVD